MNIYQTRYLHKENRDDYDKAVSYANAQLENDDDEVIIMQYDNVSEDYDSFLPVSEQRILEGVYETLRKKYAPLLEQLDQQLGESES